MANFDGKSTTHADTNCRVSEMGTMVEETTVEEATVAEKHRGTITDQRDMQVLGRKQQLRRNFGFLSITGFGSNLMVTWEIVLAGSVTSSLTNGGTAGLFWGYTLVVVAYFLVYASLAEMASMAPTSGGQYHWVSEFAPRSCQRYLSYLIGWMCFLGWQSNFCGVSFLVGTVLQGLISLCDPTYHALAWQGTMIVIGVILLTIIFNIFLVKKLPYIEGMLVILHVMGLFAIMIPLWVLAPRNNAKAVFTEFTNNGGWSTKGISFMVGLNPIVVTLNGFDSIVHMAEETKNAAKTIPRTIMWSMALNAAMGFAMMVTIVFTWGDMEEIRQTPTLYPFIQVFYNSTQSLGGTAAMTGVIILTLLSSTIATLATTSRQIWSFARDGGVPFSATISEVSQRWLIPINAVLVTMAAACVLSLINIGSTTAINAFFTLGVGGGLTSYMISIGCLIWKRLCGESLPQRPWSLGRYGLAINLASLCFLALFFVWGFVPPVTPVEPKAMNWGCLIYGFVVIFATIYYILCGKKVYNSPVEKVRRYLQK
ncbi:hypothetical protein GJ744_007790 [Endocarpon pusillum]|uniref:Choline transport protein n=1 Tax=Endocarpon pusillum TaxID=364733 RepID=A0A8H7AUF2_9EURO|nr:hypothetical protein GJ744_007790 [Endocarpon pusillum]